MVAVSVMVLRKGDLVQEREKRGGEVKRSAKIIEGGRKQISKESQTHCRLAGRAAMEIRQRKNIPAVWAVLLPKFGAHAI